MVRVDLNQWLHKFYSLVWQSLAVAFSEECEQFIFVDDALIYLLIIFLYCCGHLVDLLVHSFFQAFKCHCIHDRNNFSCQFRLAIDHLRNHLLSFVCFRLPILGVPDFFGRTDLLFVFFKVLTARKILVRKLSPGRRRSKVCHQCLQVNQLDRIWELWLAKNAHQAVNLNLVKLFYPDFIATRDEVIGCHNLHILFLFELLQVIDNVISTEGFSDR